MLKCSDNTLYTGITNDLPRRLASHTDGTGAKYTRGRHPFTLLHTEDYETKSDALKREKIIKALPRAQKLKLANTNP